MSFAPKPVSPSDNSPNSLGLPLQLSVFLKMRTMKGILWPCSAASRPPYNNESKSVSCPPGRRVPHREGRSRGRPGTSQRMAKVPPAVIASTAYRTWIVPNILRSLISCQPIHFRPNTASVAFDWSCRLLGSWRRDQRCLSWVQVAPGEKVDLTQVGCTTSSAFLESPADAHLASSDGYTFTP